MKDFKLKINKPELKRAFILIEDSEFTKAYTLIDDYLNHDPENAYAYLGLLLIDYKINRIELLSEMEEPFAKNENYKKILRFGNKKTVTFVRSANSHIEYRQSRYEEAINLVNLPFQLKNYLEAIKLWEYVIDFKDSKDRMQKAIEDACDLANQRYLEISKTVRQDNNNVEIAKSLYDLSFNYSLLQKKIDSYNKAHTEKKKLNFSYSEIFTVLALYKKYLPNDYPMEYSNLQDFYLRKKKKKKIVIVSYFILIAVLLLVLYGFYLGLTTNSKRLMIATLVGCFVSSVAFLVLSIYQHSA